MLIFGLLIALAHGADSDDGVLLVQKRVKLMAEAETTSVWQVGDGSGGSEQRTGELDEESTVMCTCTNPLGYMGGSLAHYAGLPFGGRFTCTDGTEDECPSIEGDADGECTSNKAFPKSKLSTVCQPTMRCGKNSEDAKSKCGAACPSGTKADCPSGEFCHAGLPVEGVCAFLREKPEKPEEPDKPLKCLSGCRKGNYIKKKSCKKKNAPVAANAMVSVRLKRGQKKTRRNALRSATRRTETRR
jgi:hypothetical protein